MKKLKEYTYRKLVEMAESLLSGMVEPIPLVTDGKFPCAFCGYADICGNSDGSIISRTPDEEELEKVEEILSDRLEKE